MQPAGWPEGACQKKALSQDTDPRQAGHGPVTGGDAAVARAISDPESRVPVVQYLHVFEFQLWEIAAVHTEIVRYWCSCATSRILHVRVRS